MSKRWKKGYKVLRQDGQKLVSSTLISWECKYGLNKSTKRPTEQIGSRVFVGGPLCVFKKFEDAYDFYFHGVYCDAIFECKYKESEDTKIWHLRGKRYANKCYVKGNVLADEVKLIKRVAI